MDSKRRLAKLHRGVTYDARIDKFTAAVYIDGKRKWLGTFATAEAAGEAFREAREANPGQRSGLGFTHVYRAFREAHGGLDGTPSRGDVLEFGGVRFMFQSLVWRRPQGRAFAFYEFAAECCECSRAFTTLVPAAVSSAKAITRRCEEHRRRRATTFGRTADKAAVLPEEPQVPLDEDGEPIRRLRDGTLATPERIRELAKYWDDYEKFKDIL